MRQYLFFNLGDEKFAINSQWIKEIVDYDKITNIPNSSDLIMGVINIRGDIIPVIDMLARFNTGNTQIKNRTSFVLIEVLNKTKGTYTTISIMVDLVLEVEEIEEVDILDAPKFGTKIDSLYIENIIDYENKHIMALNIDNILDVEQLKKLD